MRNFQNIQINIIIGSLVEYFASITNLTRHALCKCQVWVALFPQMLCWIWLIQVKQLPFPQLDKLWKWCVKEFGEINYSLSNIDKSWTSQDWDLKKIMYTKEFLLHRFNNICLAHINVYSTNTVPYLLRDIVDIVWI